MTDDKDLIDAIQGSALAKLTKQNYLSRLNVMKRMFEEKPIYDILLLGEEAVDKIIKAYPSSKSQKNFLVVVLALFKYCDGLKEKVPKDIWRIWATSYNSCADRIDEQTMLNLPSDRQRAGYIEYEEFKKRIDTLPKKSVDRLLLAMYGLIEPLRGDYNRVRIYKGKLPAKDREENYLNITGTRMTLHIGEHKTSMTYGAIVTDLPKDLEKEIRENLRITPRDWLFEDKNGNPYEPNAFIKLVARRFEKIFDRPLNIGILRHSYINSLDMNTLSMAERQKIARQMGHNYIQQERYRLLMDEKKAKKKSTTTE